METDKQNIDINIKGLTPIIIMIGVLSMYKIFMENYWRYLK